MLSFFFLYQNGFYVTVFFKQIFVRVKFLMNFAIIFKRMNSQCCFYLLLFTNPPWYCAYDYGKKKSTFRGIVGNQRLITTFFNYKYPIFIFMFIYIYINQYSIIVARAGFYSNLCIKRKKKE